MADIKLQEIAIEKDVPIKDRYPRNAFTNVARQMDIGDSIFSADSRVINGVMTALNKLGRSGTTRAETKDGVEGRRLWRTPDRPKTQDKCEDGDESEE